MKMSKEHIGLAQILVKYLIIVYGNALKIRKMAQSLHLNVIIFVATDF
jgi:hypothetical protein